MRIWTSQNEIQLKVSGVNPMEEMHLRSQLSLLHEFFSIYLVWNIAVSMSLGL